MPTASTTQDQILAIVQQLQIKVEKLEIELAKKIEENNRLKATNEKLSRMLFGAKSERFVDPAPDHPTLTGFEEVLAATEPAEEPTTTVPAHERRASSKQTGRMELPAHLPREERIVDVPEAQKVDPVTGAPLKFIGHEVSERLARRQGFFVVVIKRAKYANPDRPLSGVITALTPPCAIEKSLFDDSFLAWLLISKAVDHLPIDRITKILQRDGLDFSRSTLNNLFHQGAKVLMPLYDAMVAELVSGNYVHSDDTPVRMQEPGSGKTREARFWGVVAGIGPPLTAYEFTCSRQGKWPALFFAKFKGFFHADDYAGYDRLFSKRDESGNPVVIHVGCWAHARRKFDECLKPVSLPEAQAMLALIRKLYDADRQHRRVSPDERRSLRQAESRPVAEAIFALALDILRRQPPRSPLAAAAAYMLRLKEQLSLFLEHPELGLDNNPVENANRPVALGRKNWLFVGNEECGQNLAVIMSLTTTCTKLGINPQEYLADILPRIQDHSASKIRDLLPDRWLAARQAAAPPKS